MNMKEHLLSRKYDVSSYLHHEIDEENSLATFFLFDENGRWTGYQKYNPLSTNKNIDNNEQSGRYFNKNIRGELTVWGLETLQPGPLFVTESIFKTAAIHMAGFNAITQLCAGCSKRFLAFCDSLGKDGLFFVGDCDKAGIKFSEYRPHGFVLPLDLDEYETSELRSMLSKHLELYKSEQ